MCVCVCVLLVVIIICITFMNMLPSSSFFLLFLLFFFFPFLTYKMLENVVKRSEFVYLCTPENSAIQKLSIIIIYSAMVMTHVRT